MLENDSMRGRLVGWGLGKSYRAVVKCLWDASPIGPEFWCRRSSQSPWTRLIINSRSLFILTAFCLIAAKTHDCRRSLGPFRPT